MAQSLLEVEGLRKCFGEKLVLADLDFAVAAGEVTGFVGPNGAGKTTCIRAILGLVRPDAGRIQLLGAPWRRQALARVGALVEGPAFHGSLSARDNLQRLVRLGQLPEGAIQRELRRVGLAAHAERSVSEFSLGMRQRLGLAAALLPEPELLILDEPANGLDPAGVVELRALLRQLADGGMGVLVSSHQLGEIEAICDKLVCLERGTLVFSGSLEQARRAAGPRIRMTVTQPEALPELRAALTDLAPRTDPEDPLSSLLLAGERAEAVRCWQASVELEVPLSELALVRPSLEQAFFSMLEAPAEGELGTLQAVP